MSIKVMSQVWEHSKHKGGKLLVLLALADHANDQGYCWPSVATLAKKARLSDRHVRRILNELEETGELVIEHRYGTSNYYRVMMPKSEGGQDVTPDAHVTPPLTPMSGGYDTGVTQTVMNRHVEPSSTKGAQAPQDPPTSLDEWLDLIRDSDNRVATLRWMVEVIFPYYKQEDLPSYGYVGKLAKKHGAGYLATLIWRNAEHRPQGNLMTYIQGILNKNGNHRAPPSPRRDPAAQKAHREALDAATPTPEEALAFQRSMALADAKKGKESSPYYEVLTDEERAEHGIAT